MAALSAVAPHTSIVRRGCPPSQPSYARGSCVPSTSSSSSRNNYNGSMGYDRTKAGANRRSSGAPWHGRAWMERPSLLRARAAEDEEMLEYSGESFYDIFSVTPDADAKEIKRAYYTLMRECHPDQSGEDEATDFCVMLNDIYETLMDPARRALYDDIAGFSIVSTNPFLDDRQERDLVFVDEVSCIGCRNCNHVCPQTFAMEDLWGRARVMKQKVDSDEKLQEAIDTCPVSCIHWVSAPQLTLLEASMARMERIAVWSLMAGNGANLDVFTEASISWQKRYSEIQARRAAAEAGAPRGADPRRGGSWADGLWNSMKASGVDVDGATGSQFYEQAESSRRAREEAQEAGEPVDGKMASGIASLAARAARASRSWRVFQEFERNKNRASTRSLSSSSSMDESDVDQDDLRDMVAQAQAQAGRQ